MEKDVHFDDFKYSNQQSCQRTVGLCCGLLCSYIEKDVHFDGFSYTNPQSCHRTVALYCVLCSCMGKDNHFDGFSCITHQQPCLSLLHWRTVFCFEAEFSLSTLKYMHYFKHCNYSCSFPIYKTSNDNVIFPVIAACFTLVNSISKPVFIMSCRTVLIK